MNRNEQKGSEKILIVDDIEINVEILENIIQAEGYETLRALNVKEALEIMNQAMPQIILSDYSMPDMNGVEFCRLMKKNPKTRDIRFILITVADSTDVKKSAFEAGVADYILKPYERVEVVMRVNNQMNIYRQEREIEEHNRMMHRVIMDQKTIMSREQENLLLAFAKVLEERDDDRRAHIERVGHNSKILAQSLFLMEQYENVINDEFADVIFTAAKLHNVGDLLLSDELIKKGKIHDSVGREEYLKAHTEKGQKLLEEIAVQGSKSWFLEMAAEIAGYHHAYWDGSGVPNSAKGEEIPISARIVTVVDDFDCLMLSHKGNEDGEVSAETVLNKMEEASGTLYDPKILRVFLKITKQLKMP